MNYSYKKINKICKQCGKEMIEVDPSRLFCDECNKMKYIESKQKTSEKGKQNRLKNKEQELSDNFNKYKNNIENYTAYNFNKISKMKTKSYTRYFKMNWIDVLKYYNVFEDFYDMLQIKFIDFCNKNDTESTRAFCRKNNLTDLETGISMQQFREDCGFIRNKHTDKELKENLFDLKNKLGHFPLFNEFRELSPITALAYKCHLKLDNSSYNEILKQYLTEEEFNEYLNLRLTHKSDVGKQTCKMNKILISEIELEEEFKKTFDGFKKEYNVYPPMRIFNKISRYDESTYRRFFNMNWTNVCSHFGYDIEDRATGEYIFLCKINKILDNKCKRQKMWDWLIGTKGKKLKVDGYYEDYNLVVEFDGRQHKEPVLSFGGEKTFKIQQLNDGIKNKLIPEHKIQLLRVSASEDWFNEEHLRNRLINIGIKIPNNQIEIQQKEVS